MTCGSYYTTYYYGYRTQYLYDLCPGFRGNMTFLVIFGLIFLAQLVQGIYWRQWWFLGWWFAGCGLQAGIFASRVAIYYAGHIKQSNEAELVCSYLAPAFHVVGIYYLLSKLVAIYGPRYSPLSARTIWLSFTGAGIAAIAVLAGGTGYYLSRLAYYNSRYVAYYYSSSWGNYGGWIVFAGLVVQFITMTVFFIFLCIFVHRVRTDKSRSYNQEWDDVRSRPLFRILTPMIFLSFIFIYGRTIAKVVTLFTGWGPDYEIIGVLSLVFDTIFMALATFILTIVYPGACFGRGRIPLTQFSANVQSMNGSKSKVNSNTEADVYYTYDRNAM